jgi:hypothetical protein
VKRSLVHDVRAAGCFAYHIQNGSSHSLIERSKSFPCKQPGELGENVKQGFSGDGKQMMCGIADVAIQKTLWAREKPFGY